MFVLGLAKPSSIIKRLFIGIANTFRLDVALRAKRTPTWFSPLGARVVSPSKNLRQCFDLVNLIGRNFPRNNDLVSFCLIGVKYHADCFRCGHFCVCLIVVTNNNTLIVRYSEVNADDCALAAPLEFAQPLM